MERACRVMVEGMGTVSYSLVYLSYLFPWGIRNFNRHTMSTHIHVLFSSIKRNRRISSTLHI